MVVHNPLARVIVGQEYVVDVYEGPSADARQDFEELAMHVTTGPQDMTGVDEQDVAVGRAH